MKRILLLVAALLSVGCVQYTAEIHIKKDGSGQIIQEILFTDFLDKTLGAMMGGMFGGEVSAPLQAGKSNMLMDTLKLKAAASKLGDGVRFVSASPLSKGDAKGVRAIYAFADITKLKVSQNPLIASGLPVQGENLDLDLVEFRFRKGTPARLEVLHKSVKQSQGSNPPGQNSSPKNIAKDPVADSLSREILEKFRGLRSAIYLVVDGEIKSTNATFRNDKRITLLEMDFNEMMREEKRLLALQNSPPENITEAKAALGGIPGFKVDANDTLRVEFR